MRKLPYLAFPDFITLAQQRQVKETLVIHGPFGGYVMVLKNAIEAATTQRQTKFAVSYRVHMLRPGNMQKLTYRSPRVDLDLPLGCA